MTHLPVRVDHLLQQLCHIVLLGADAAVVAAIVAGAAIADLLFRHANLFNLIAGLCRPTQELVAEQIGVAALPGAARKDQNFLTHSNNSLIDSDGGVTRSRFYS